MLSLIPAPYRWLAALLLAGAAATAVMGYRAHLIHQGERLESARRDAQDAELSRAAQDERNRLNRQVADARAQLAVAIANLNAKKQELQDVQDRNSTLQRDLAAGTRRLLVLTRPTANADPAGHADGAAAGGLDPQPGARTELDPAAAASLAGLTGEGDSAIIRLNACIAAYAAVKAAADKVNSQ